MKTIMQIVLPIAALVGLVFGITFVSNYSPKKNEKNDGVKLAEVQELPLKFVTIAGRNDPSVPYLRNFRSDYELKEPGHFDFWFRNNHEQNVRVAFTTASCTCAGVDLGVIPAEAWTNYLQRSAANSLVGTPLAPILLAAAAAEFQTQIQWNSIAADGKKSEGSVPSASTATGPQMGILRLNWYGKGEEGPKNLSADVAMQLPNSTAKSEQLKASYNVVPPFNVQVIGNKDAERTVRFSDLFANSKITREVVFWSRTRPELNLTLSAKEIGDAADCVQWTKAELLTAQELADFTQKMREENNWQGVQVQSAYRTRITVNERREFERDGNKVVKQLDMGPIEFYLKVAEDDGKAIGILISGLVRGDIRILAGQVTDRIDFGAAFLSVEGKSKQVLLLSDRAGLDLDLTSKESTPDYLDVDLKQESETEGRKQWILNVRIPEGKLYGTLTGGYIIVKTNDSPPRKIRIPVKASTYDNGSPRF